jgi:hypothetical protein
MVATFLAAVLVFTSMPIVFSADSATLLTNTSKAATLKDLGLYSGQDANDPKIGLENPLTTQDSLIFLAKLFGYYEAANNLSDVSIAQGLAKFDDAAAISDYAQKVVAYSAMNDILMGSKQGDQYYTGAKDTVTAARFSTFMLRTMGYTVEDYLKSVTTLAETKGSKIDATLTGDLTRDAAVGVMYGALTAEKASGRSIIEDIINDNPDAKKIAESLGLIEPAPERTTRSEDSRPRVIDYPKVEQDSFAIPEKGLIFIKYTKAMNEEQMLDVGNYQVSIDLSIESLNDNVTFTTIAAVSLINDRTVKLQVERIETDNSPIKTTVMINPITDFAGNKLYNSDEPYSITLAGSDYFIIEKAELISKKEIMVEFNKALGSIDFSNIKLTNLTAPGSIYVESTPDDNPNIAILNLNQDLSTDVTDEGGNRIGITELVSQYPDTDWRHGVMAQITMDIVDKAAPEIVEVLQGVTLGSITILFSEDITYTNDPEKPNFIVQQYSYTETLVDSKTVLLTLDAGFDIPAEIIVTQISDIFDEAGNGLAPGSTWTLPQVNNPPETT